MICILVYVCVERFFCLDFCLHEVIAMFRNYAQCDDNDIESNGTTEFLST